MSTALTQLYYHTMARPRVVSEKESLLEGESGPTPAEKTLPTPCQQDRSWPSLEDGNGDLYSGNCFFCSLCSICCCCYLHMKYRSGTCAVLGTGHLFRTSSVVTGLSTPVNTLIFGMSSTGRCNSITKVWPTQLCSSSLAYTVTNEVSVPRPPTKAMTGLVGTAWGGSFRRV